MVKAASTDPDAIVVLGCAMREGARPGAAAERRARRAAEAFHDGHVRLVVASGGRRWFGSPEADVLLSRLLALGVPEGVIVRELCSLSTVENAAYSAEILRASGVHRPAIVTCEWHMPRALACFAWMGLRATGLPARPRYARATTLLHGAGERVRRLVDRRTALEWAQA